MLELGNRLSLLVHLILWGSGAGLISTTVLYFIASFKKIKNLTKANYFCTFILPLYLVILFGVFFADRGYYSGYKLSVPFSSYAAAMNEKSMYLLSNIILHFVVMMPLGFLLPTLIKRWASFGKVISIGFLFSVLVEFIQLITHKGLFSFDDIIGNVIGCAIGFGVFCFVRYVFRKAKKHNGELSINLTKKEVTLAQLPLLVTVVMFAVLSVIIVSGNKAGMSAKDFYREKVFTCFNTYQDEIRSYIKNEKMNELSELLEAREITHKDNWVQVECFRSFDGNNLSYYGIWYLDDEGVFTSKIQLDSNKYSVDENKFEYIDEVGDQVVLERISDNYFYYQITY